MQEKTMDELRLNIILNKLEKLQEDVSFIKDRLDPDVMIRRAKEEHILFLIRKALQEDRVGLHT